LKSSQIISSISSVKSISIFSFFFASSSQQVSHLNWLFLCIIYTFSQIPAKYNDSVKAVFPHQTTTTFLSLKNIQSQVAQ
jgi:hypothetical protein